MNLISRCLSTGRTIVLVLVVFARSAAAQSYESARPNDLGAERENVPPGHHVEKHARRGWVIAGSIVLGGLYGLGLLSASSQDGSSPSKWLPIPILGPWIALGTLGSYDEAACDRQVAAGKICPSKSGAKTAYTMLGIGQLAGVGMIVGGVLAKRTEIVPDFAVHHDLALAPLYAGNSPAGMAIAGTF